ncbi:MAG: hypothetical protein IRZ07_10445 [Microbispora sp.]|nr:hypothetical protein [Microbispora sp.]
MIFTTEAVLACGYAAGLLVIAAGLDRMARRFARRPERRHTAGCARRPDHDAGVCPPGRTPRVIGRDRPRRAGTSICDACPGTPGHICSGGREVVGVPRPWPHSEAGRFHRGLALVPVVLAASLTLIEAVRHPVWPDLALAAAAFTATAVTARWLIGRLRATPAGFPEPDPEATDRHTSAWRSEP